jgi:DNA polymerase elongation subunit (family B)
MSETVKQLLFAQAVTNHFNGKTKSFIVEKVKNKTTGKVKKRVIFDENPDFHFYKTKKGHELDYAAKCIPVEKVERIDCKYNQLFELIAKITHKEEEYEQIISENKRYKLAGLHNDYNIHQSDVVLDDYLMMKWARENKDVTEPIALHKAYFDIEVDIINYDGFPQPEEAPCEVNFISYLSDKNLILNSYILYNRENTSMREFLRKAKMDKETNSLDTALGNEWALKVLEEHFTEPNPKSKSSKPLKGLCVRVFTSEQELIKAFFDDVHEDKPDFLGGWNSHFDIQTIKSRLENHLDEKAVNFFCPSDFPFKKVDIRKDEHAIDVSDRAHEFSISGYTIFCDLLYYYASIRKTSKGKKESWKLGDILLEELGESKFEYEGSIKDAAYMNYEAFLIYSQIDSYRLYQLEEKNGDVDLLYGMSLLTHTRIEKVMRKTISLKNLATTMLFDNGYALCNNHNKFIKTGEKKKFRGALTISAL